MFIEKSIIAHKGRCRLFIYTRCEYNILYEHRFRRFREKKMFFTTRIAGAMSAARSHVHNKTNIEWK